MASRSRSNNYRKPGAPWEHDPTAPYASEAGRGSAVLDNAGRNPFDVDDPFVVSYGGFFDPDTYRDALAVRCPSCGSAAGNTCVTEAGYAYPAGRYTHLARRALLTAIDAFGDDVTVEFDVAVSRRFIVVDATGRKIGYVRS